MGENDLPNWNRSAFPSWQGCCGGAHRSFAVALLVFCAACASSANGAQAMSKPDRSAKVDLTEPARNEKSADSGPDDPVTPGREAGLLARNKQEKSKPGGTSTAEPDAAKKQDAKTDDQEKRGEWLIAPIPINSPAIGAGLEYFVGYVFPFSKQDKVSPPSIAGVGGLFTNNGSRAFGIGGKVYLKEDKYRLTLGGGHVSVNADLYGVGKVAGDRGLFLPLNTKGTGIIGESLFAVRKGIYLGFRFQYRNLRLSIDRTNSDLPDDIETNPPAQVADIIDAIRDNLFRQRTVSIGPKFQWDTRDNTFYPRRGIYLDSGIDFFATGLGSKFTYQFYKAAFNKYTSLGEHQVLAFRGMGCAAAGDRVPIYDICLFGAWNDLRGYSAGRYQDRRMFATQAEYRVTMPKPGFLGRFGAVAFGGIGGVGPTFEDIGVSAMLPAGGAGLRFRLTKKNPINFRVDYGWGKAGGTLCIGVGEAF